MLRLETEVAAGSWPAADWDTLAGNWAQAALAAIGASWLEDAQRNVEIAVLLADDAILQQLNRDWRSRDEPTNVLSFPALEAPPGPPLDAGPPLPLGDIALSCETVQREAQAQGKRFIDHAAHLVIHGVLHLMGLDHVHDADAEQMEAAECRALESLGIADPYAGGPIGHD